jgi:hypothetical protein
MGGKIRGNEGNEAERRCLLGMNDRSDSEKLPRPADADGGLCGRLWGAMGKRPGLCALVCLGVVVAGFYAEEDWRGWYAWKQYKDEAVARGLSLDYASYIPKPVPDEENFAATLYLGTFMHGGPGVLAKDLYSLANDHVSEYVPKTEKGLRHLTDLVAWQQAAAALEVGELTNNQRFGTNKTDLESRAAAAPAVLEGLKPNAEMFTQLRKESSRKYSRFPVNYNLEKPWLTLLPHLSPVNQTCQRLELQACAELALGQSNEALADMKLMLAMADSIKTEPILISFLVRMACVQTTIQPVWEGLAEHAWSEAQLEALQTRYLSYDFVSEMDRALKAERAYGNLFCDQFRKQGYGALSDDSMASQPSSGVNFLRGAGKVVPSGWFDLEELNFNRTFDDMIRGALDPVGRQVSPRAVSEVGAFIGLPMPTPQQIAQHRLLASFLLPSLGRMPLKAAVNQVVVDQAALACALESCRLANGQYPETLNALVPQFMAHLPNDVITGQPYKYRRTADGHFVLYSVGWNAKDDGGVPGQTLFDQTKGDWVWEYPGKG